MSTAASGILDAVLRWEDFVATDSPRSLARRVALALDLAAARGALTVRLLVLANADPAVADAIAARSVDFIGGCPNLEVDPASATERLIGLAASAGIPLEVHLDETIDPAVDLLAVVLDELARFRDPPSLTVGHAVSLAARPVDEQRVAARLAVAGVAVVALPATNLFLQARHVRTSAPCGITACRTLLEAGVTLAAGSDNVQDVFYPGGCFDPLETAHLLVLAGHVDPLDALAAVSTSARRAMGRPADDIQPGAAAEVVAVRGRHLGEVLATRSLDRLALRAGVLTPTTAPDPAPRRTRWPSGYQ